MYQWRHLLHWIDKLSVNALVYFLACCQYMTYIFFPLTSRIHRVSFHSSPCTSFRFPRKRTPRGCGCEIFVQSHVAFTFFFPNHWCQSILVFKVATIGLLLVFTCLIVVLTLSFGLGLQWLVYCQCLCVLVCHSLLVLKGCNGGFSVFVHKFLLSPSRLIYGLQWGCLGYLHNGEERCVHIGRRGR